MLKYLVINRHPIFWILIHVLLGALCTLSPLPIIIWFYLVLGSSLLLLTKKSGNVFFWLTCIIIYTISFEVLARMSKTSPFVPYETGKYLFFIFLVSGILYGYRKGGMGWIMFWLLIPGILIDLSGMVEFKQKIFNVLGPVNIALAIIYFKGQEVTKENVITFFRLLVYPLISVLTFVIFKASDLDNIHYKLNANFETSGDFGSNQVSTALGLGAFLAFLFWRNKWQLSGYRWIDSLIFVTFILRGLLTFSRGGMIGGALGILIIILFKDQLTPNKSIKNLSTRIALAITAILILIFTFKYADNKTDGMLSLRYQGETAGTISGTKEKTLNSLTTNRINILEDDLNLWTKHPILGVGVGASAYLRESTRNTSPHIEVSRLLSEHGIPGLIIIIMLLYLAFLIYRNRINNPMGMILFAFFVIAFYTTFHAATRTYISPLLIGLSLITVHRHEEANKYMS